MFRWFSPHKSLRGDVVLVRELLFPEYHEEGLAASVGLKSHSWDSDSGSISSFPLWRRDALHIWEVCILFSNPFCRWPWLCISACERSTWSLRAYLAHTLLNPRFLTMILASCSFQKPSWPCTQMAQHFSYCHCHSTIQWHGLQQGCACVKSVGQDVLKHWRALQRVASVFQACEFGRVL